MHMFFERDFRVVFTRRNIFPPCIWMVSISKLRNFYLRQLAGLATSRSFQFGLSAIFSSASDKLNLTDPLHSIIEWYKKTCWASHFCSKSFFLSVSEPVPRVWIKTRRTFPLTSSKYHDYTKSLLLRIIFSLSKLFWVCGLCIWLLGFCNWSFVVNLVLEWLRID